jgi:hypothetical protein
MVSARARAALLGLVAIAGGCLDERPSVVVGRNATGGSTGGGEPAPQELRPLDDPSCLRCADVVGQGLPSASVCVADGPPSSAERLAAYFDCVCRAQCVEACALHCEGAPRDATCEACVAARCNVASQACGGGAP